MAKITRDQVIQAMAKNLKFKTYREIAFEMGVTWEDLMDAVHEYRRHLLPDDEPITD